MKAQFWSFDVIFAVVIFSTAITIMAFTWFNINNQLSLSYSNGASIMQLQLQSLSQSLLSPGSPSSWQSTVNTTNVSTWSGVSAGLGSGQGSVMLSSPKVYALMSMANYNYQESKQVLGTGFDYYITIKSNPATGSGINVVIGRSPYSNGAKTVYVQYKSAIINGMPVTMQVILWTNTTLVTS